jgi:hypothetical protein
VATRTWVALPLVLLEIRPHFRTHALNPGFNAECAKPAEDFRDWSHWIVSVISAISALNPLRCYNSMISLELRTIVANFGPHIRVLFCGVVELSPARTLCRAPPAEFFT